MDMKLEKRHLLQLSVVCLIAIMKKIYDTFPSIT